MDKWLESEKKSIVSVFKQGSWFWNCPRCHMNSYPCDTWRIAMFRAWEHIGLWH